MHLYVLLFKIASINPDTFLPFNCFAFTLASTSFSKQLKGIPRIRSRINGITLLTLCVANDCENTIMMAQCRQKLM